MFFVVFFGLYSCFHLFALMTLKRALHPNLAAMLAIIAFMLLMIAAPVLVRILERHQMATAARLLAYIGYLWMGLLFFFCHRQPAGRYGPVCSMGIGKTVRR